MEPPDPLFADMFNIPQNYAILVFDVRRVAVSLPFQVYRLKVLVEAGLVAFSSACFEFAGEVPKEARHGIFAKLHGFSKVAVMGFCTQVTTSLLSLLSWFLSSQPSHQGPRTNPVLGAGA